MDSAIFLEKLTAFPHRGAGTNFEQQAAELISNRLRDAGFKVENQPFRTPATYVTIVYWLIGALITGLIALPFLGTVSVGLVGLATINGLLYFDWRYSWLIHLPPLIDSKNIIGVHQSDPNGRGKVVLMAHYDTAPVSALYKKQTRDGFRNSIRFSMILIALSVPVVGFSYHLPDNIYLLIIRFMLVIYFLGQAILGTIGYWKKGYTNGASDNATGVTAAIETGIRLKKEIPALPLEIVLTSAEEAGMIGAYHYFRKRFNKEQTAALINFDTLGHGELKVITQTGSLSPITYDNLITKAAVRLIQNDKRFRNIRTDAWHTADFDSAWFVRAGVPCVTLAALDANGLMPHIHRPEDTLDHVDTRPMNQAIELAVATVKALDNVGMPASSSTPQTRQ